MDADDDDDDEEEDKQKKIIEAKRARQDAVACADGGLERNIEIKNNYSSFHWDSQRKRPVCEMAGMNVNENFKLLSGKFGLLFKSFFEIERAENFNNLPKRRKKYG